MNQTHKAVFVLWTIVYGLMGIRTDQQLVALEGTQFVNPVYAGLLLANTAP